MIVTCQSQLSGEVNSMDLDITEDQLMRWRDGNEFIQDVFPHLKASEREFLLTGITPQEWAGLFGAEETA